METTESTRQQKVARQIQKDISDLFLKECADTVRGAMVSVTRVRMSPDLGYAKIYLSVFPFEKSENVMTRVEKDNWKIRKALGTRIRFQLKTLPELAFFLDDSLEYIKNIDELLKEDKNEE